MEIRLEVVKGPDTGKVFTINKVDTYIVGRSSDVHFRFSDEDPYISRRHFLLEVAPPHVYFKDLEVTNPSRINDMYVDEAELADGDMIEVGFTGIKVSLDMTLSTKTIYCKQCGKAIDIFDDENPDQVCAACQEQAEADQESVSAKPDQKSEEIKCRCGRDLTSKADSDGRAAELKGKVVYSCSKCLPERGKDAGLRINDYEVIKKLGEGGMGKVYLAYQQTTARLVALKVMNIADKSLGARFDREIRLIRSLRHENVLAYVDSALDKKTKKPYLAMEYAAHGSLYSVMMDNKRPPALKDSLRYLIGSLKGLEFVHGQGIVHRDIKPENILLGGDVKRPEPRIADFGLAKQFSRAGGSMLTKLGTAMGTLLYMPPEQIKDTRSVREPADVYAMGVTLYHLLTAKYPFNFPSPLDILEFIEKNKGRVKKPEEALQMMMEVQKLKSPHLIILTEDPIPIRKRNAKIPAKLAAVVDKAIKKNIPDRIQSAGEFRSELEKIMNKI